MSMHSRKYLRIEGDLATQVTEVTEREVALDDLAPTRRLSCSDAGGVANR